MSGIAHHPPCDETRNKGKHVTNCERFQQVLVELVNSAHTRNVVNFYRWIKTGQLVDACRTTRLANIALGEIKLK